MDIQHREQPLRFRNAIVDYIRVAVIAVIVLVTIFIVRMTGNRPVEEKQRIQENDGVPSLVDRNL